MLRLQGWYLRLSWLHLQDFLAGQSLPRLPASGWGQPAECKFALMRPGFDVILFFLAIGSGVLNGHSA